MKKIILAILFIFVAAIPVRACDATRKKIFPGVVWCNGCCEREGYFWIEVKNRQYLMHKERNFIGGGTIMCLGIVTGVVAIKRKNKSKPEDSDWDQ